MPPTPAVQDTKLHGRGFRRTVALLLAYVVGAWVLSASTFAGARHAELLRAAVGAAVCVVGYVWLALWPGVAWDEQGVKLTYATRSKRVRWSDIEGFEWHPSGTVKRLAIHAGRRKPIKVPTVYLVGSGDWYGRFWESNRLCGRDEPPGAAPDAMEALTGAWQAATSGRQIVAPEG
jgi:hypothetical protein